MATSQASTRLGPAAGSSSSARPLRTFLALDAVVTAANGLIYLLAAGPVADLFDMEAGFLRGIGIFLTVYGALVGLLATQQVPSSLATKAVIDANLLWAAASVAVAAVGWFGPNTIATVWIVMQAAVVGAFGALQISGLRKLTR